MLVWFVTLTLAGTYLVFGDPLLDYRVLAVGSVLPDVVDLVLRRGLGPAHSVVVVVMFLLVVMVSTIGRRPLRKRLLPLAIGGFAHLVLDGVWNNTAAFWWPIGSRRVDGPLPSFERWPVVAIVMELVGVGVGVWWVRKFGLFDARRRIRFLRTGTVEGTMGRRS